MNYGKQASRQRIKDLDAKGSKVGNKIGLWIGKIALAAMFVLAVVAASSAIGIWKGIIDSAPQITASDVTPTGYATEVYDSDGNQITTLVAAGSNRKYVDLDGIPKHLQEAFIAIEDSRFYQHNGIDSAGIVRALWVAATGGQMQGASTITQQLVKNNVLTSWTSETSFIEKLQRKIQEQYLAVQLEKMVDKDWILENYLNTINLGANTLGVQAASMKYFNKDVSELTISECAVIAGITQNPIGYNPITHPDKNAERRETVLNAMKDQGYITQAEYDEAMADDVYSRIAEYNTGNGASVNSYFVDAMIDDVLEDLVNELGYTEYDAYKALYQGGLKIYSTQDSEIQKIADEEINDADNYSVGTKVSFSMSFQVKYDDGTTKTFTHQTMLKYYQKSNADYNINFSSEEKAQAAIDKYKKAVLKDGGTIIEGSESVTFTLQPQVAATIIDNETGNVVALVGGRGEKEGNMTLNRATDTTRQPGSCFKIIGCYAAALDGGGLTLADVQDDAPFTVGKKEYKNWDKTYAGYSTLRQGIYHSMNIVTVKTLQQIGVDVGFQYAQSFGITTLVDEDKNLGLCLGGLTYGVTNYELTRAYATIANGGTYRDAKFYTKVVDSEGNVLLDYTQTQESHRVVREATAYLVTSAMEDVLTIGTGKIAHFDGGMAQAAKSGTTTSGRDTLFQGFTPYYTLGLWGGYDDNMVQSSTSYTKVIWGKIMGRIHKNLENKQFEMPDDIVQVEVCKKSGKLPVEGVCDSDPRGSMVYTEYFEKGTEPTETCTTHIALDICKVSGLIANSYCDPAKIIRKIFVTGAAEGSGEGKYNVAEDFLNKVCTIHKAGDTDTTDDTGGDDTGGDTGGDTDTGDQTDTGDTGQTP